MVAHLFSWFFLLALNEAYHILQNYSQFLFLYPLVDTILNLYILKFVHHPHYKVSPLADLVSISSKLLSCVQLPLQLWLTFIVIWLGNLKKLEAKCWTEQVRSHIESKDKLALFLSNLISFDISKLTLQMSGLHNLFNHWLLC